MKNDILSENLKDTIKYAERYVLFALACSIGFFVLSLPKPVGNQLVNWNLLGVPLSISPQLALIFLYLMNICAGLLANNMLIHVRDLVEQINDKEHVKAILSYPTVLTVSPTIRSGSTLLNTVFIVLGLIKIYMEGAYQLPNAVWWIGYGFSLVGVSNYFTILRFVKPYIYPEKKREKHQK